MVAARSAASPRTLNLDIAYLGFRLAHFASVISSYTYRFRTSDLVFVHTIIKRFSGYLRLKTDFCIIVITTGRSTACFKNICLQPFPEKNGSQREA